MTTIRTTLNGQPLEISIGTGQRIEIEENRISVLPMPIEARSITIHGVSAQELAQRPWGLVQTLQPRDSISGEFVCTGSAYDYLFPSES
jgi:hypothetical protein